MIAQRHNTLSQIDGVDSRSNGEKIIPCMEKRGISLEKRKRLMQLSNFKVNSASEQIERSSCTEKRMLLFQNI